ncbi:hypothetical protein QBC45DRAFT_124260 [Copromyces sp. CBS 386.78]|nr:hypothetical protein QBC45DRAFT_124260 [Copromyces sp. CBS 386.78]
MPHMWSAQTTWQLTPRKSEPESLHTLLTSRRVLVLLFFHPSEKKASIVAGHLTRVRPLPNCHLPFSCLAMHYSTEMCPLFSCFLLLAPWLAVPWSGFAAQFSGWRIPKTAVASLLFLNLGITRLAQARGGGKATREPQKLPSKIRGHHTRLLLLLISPSDSRGTRLSHSYLERRKPASVTIVQRCGRNRLRKADWLTQIEKKGGKVSATFVPAIFSHCHHQPLLR